MHDAVSDFAQEAAEWHERLQSASVSELEHARFRAWLYGDPARRREFDEISSMWLAVESVVELPEAVARRRALEKPQLTRGSRRAMVGWALAAGLAAAAAVLSWQLLFASNA